MVGVRSLITSIVLAQAVAGQKCVGQSCSIANLSGSTGIPFSLPEGKAKPSGSNKAGFKCIQSYRSKFGSGVDPDVAAQLGKGKLKLRMARRKWEFGFPAESDSYTGKNDASLDVESPLIGKFERRQAGACKPFTLVFARGTTEAGTMGSTVGPALQSGLNSKMPGKWSVHGVSFAATVAGDDCIGLPGGEKCMQQINKIGESCPNTKFVVSGYSLGAMVAHNCAAFASESVKKRILGVVVFGDPFNGAPIKGIDPAKIKTFCASGDGVCQGKFIISLAHLAYVGSSTGQAISWIVQNAK